MRGPASSGASAFRTAPRPRTRAGRRRASRRAPNEFGRIDMSAAQTQAPVPTWRDLVTRSEIDAWLAMTDWKSWASIALDWAITFAAMALVAVFPNPLA